MDTYDSWGPSTSLFYQEFATPAFDTSYTLSIEFTGSTFIFKCNDETYQYDITTPMYPPSEQYRELKSRVYADPGESGYMRANFDDVYTGSTPPTVSSAGPANNATDVAVNTAITATFTEAMDVSTITTTTFLVNDGSIDIAGTVSYSDMTATFTPTAALDYNTEYTATINTGAMDLAGNALEANYTWSFTTGSTFDTTPPTVSSAYPANNTVDLAVTTTITATFSETMDSYTIGPDTFLVSGSDNISGTVTYSGTTATFTPTTNLDYGKTYTATITTGAKDSAGNALQTDYTWSFTTQSGSSNGGGDEGGGGCFITTLLEN